MLKQQTTYNTADGSGYFIDGNKRKLRTSSRLLPIGFLLVWVSTKAYSTTDGRQLDLKKHKTVELEQPVEDYTNWEAPRFIKHLVEFLKHTALTSSSKQLEAKYLRI